jgi:hypothetical protein
MKKITSIIIIFVLLFVLVSCTTMPSSSARSNNKDLGNGLSRFVDKEAGVVCWMATYGLSCLPIKDTLLPLK